VTDPGLKQLLTETQTIAVVGHSDKVWRDSYRIGVYLRAEGYRVYAVNPNITEVLGQPVYPDLAAVPETIDLVDVFRASVHVPDVVTQTIAVGAKAIWTQLGVYVPPDDRARLEEAGVKIVENHCIKVDHQRLLAYHPA